MTTSIIGRGLKWFAAAFLLVVSLHVPAAAWGNAGHRIIARIAAPYLTPKTQQRIAEILKNDTYISLQRLCPALRKASMADRLACISTWADEVRFLPPYVGKGQWHYVDMRGDAGDPHDCEQGCSVERIDFYSKALNDPKSTDQDRVTALKFIVHLIGDIHQPLHCNNSANDRYGNEAAVAHISFFGNRTTLHNIWDSDLIRFEGLSEDDLVNELSNTTPQGIIPVLQQGTPLTWALESARLAPAAYQFDETPEPTPEPKRKKISFFPEEVSGIQITPAQGQAPITLGREYYRKNFQVVEGQLVKGGLRLASYLNNLFDPRGEQSVPVPPEKMKGKQELEKLPSERKSAGNAPSKLGVGTGTLDVQLTGNRAGMLTVRIVEASGGYTTEGQIVLRDEGKRIFGRYVFTNVPPGKYEILVFNDGKQIARMEETVVAGKVAEETESIKF